MRRIFWIALILALPPALAPPCGADEWEKRYPVAARPDLKLRTGDGRVRIDTWEEKSVKVTVTTRGWKVSPGQVRIEERVAGDQIELDIKIPSWTFVMNFAPRSVLIDVRLPRQGRLDVASGDGSVTVRSFSGQTRVSTGDGSVLAEELGGAIDLTTGDGNITARAIDGTLAVHTGDGRVRIDGRFDTMRLESGDGSMAVTAESGSRIGEGWSLRTGDGPLVLRLPHDFKADLDAHSGGGRISLDFPVRVSGSIRQNAVRGGLNGGGPPLELRTGDGSIRILKL